jgi:DNA replicative helicase MCM subunit Mcm2 (Cdc46/Mcm family)
LDRYRLAVTGIQNADMSYMHHISVLRSPLLIRLGLNLRGPDYDNMSFNIGRAQYRSRKMPSFTAVIDQTKIDLKHSIYNIFETGVDETIENRNTLGLIELHHSQTGYVNVAELELEELSDEDMKKFSEMESTEDVLNELTVSVINAVLEVLSNN